MVEDPARPFALIVEGERVPRGLPGYLRLMLNYLYGLEVVTGGQPREVAALLAARGTGLRAVFLLQDEPVTNRNRLLALGQRGAVPVFLLMPADLAAQHAALGGSMPKVRVCDWSQVLTSTEPSLQTTVDEAFAEEKLERLPTSTAAEDARFEARLVERLRQVTPLPTLPEFVQRIGTLLRDPRTTAADLEAVLVHDPAIVHRLLQVVNSAANAGRRDSGQWTLREAIVRLGLQQVGAIAQQIKLINSLVRPAQSQFDLRRFWEHSVGCATIADRLYTEKLIPLRQEIRFDDYWVAALLHDVGKVVLGFLAWDYFQLIVESARSHGSSFRRAEQRLGNAVTHECLGRVVLQQAGVGDEILHAVGTHNVPGAHPSALTCLVHLADALCRDLGMGCLADEPPAYNASVLVELGLSRADLGAVRDRLAVDAPTRVRKVVEMCLQE